MIITTSPSGPLGLVYDIFTRVEAGELDGWHVVRKATRELNPKISERVIARAYQRDAEAAATEYGAEWRQASESFLSGEAIDRATEKRGNSETPDPGKSYAMAIDPAVMADRYGYLIGHMDGQRLVVDYAYLLHPPIDPAAAEALLLELARRWRPFIIRTDSAAVVQRLGRELPALRYEPFTRPRKLQWYGAVKEAANLGRLGLPNHKDLLAELRALRIRNGVDIGHPKSGPVQHDDLADCLALVADVLVGGLGRAARVTPNIFYDGLSPGETFIEIGAGYQVIPIANAGHSHPLTAEAVAVCRRRMAGCPACIDYFEMSGEFERQQAAAAAALARGAGEPLSAEEADRELFGPMIDRQRMTAQEHKNDDSIRKTFARAVGRRLAGDSGAPTGRPG